MHSSSVDAGFHHIHKLHLVYDDYVKIGKELLPATENFMEDFTEYCERKSQALDDLFCLLAHANADRESVESLLQLIETVDRIWIEIKSVQKQVEDLEYKLDVRSQGVRSMDEVQSELASFEEKRYAF